MTTHFRHVCEDHGQVLAQCRCPGPKTEEKKPCPGPPICVAPGYRVTPCDLDDAEAFQAMREAADAVTKVALEARRMLLGLGMADTHSLCRQLDKTASDYTTVFQALRHQELARLEADAEAKKGT